MMLYAFRQFRHNLSTVMVQFFFQLLKFLQKGEIY